MNKCRECGAAQYEGALFCSECGRFMMDPPQQNTTPLPFTQFGHLPAPPPQLKETAELATGHKTLTLMIPTSRERLQVDLTGEIVVGRGETGESVQPELDLTRFQGDVHGVSRQHATVRLTRQGVVIVDLNSTNGTILNQYRLTPQEPYILNTGDEVQFGELLVHVFIT